MGTTGTSVKFIVSRLPLEDFVLCDPSQFLHPYYFCEKQNFKLKFTRKSPTTSPITIVLRLHLPFTHLTPTLWLLSNDIANNLPVLCPQFLDYIANNPTILHLRLHSHRHACPSSLHFSDYLVNNPLGILLRSNNQQLVALLPLQPNCSSSSISDHIVNNRLFSYLSCRIVNNPLPLLLL